MFSLWKAFVIHAMVIPFKQQPNLSSDPERGMKSFSYVNQNAQFEKTAKLNEIRTIKKSDILYYDEDLVFVNKPANLQTVPGFDDKHSLATIVQKLFSVEHIETMSPHRLDLQTSGIVVFARNVNALRSLTAQFRERTALKEYTAIVSGTLEKSSGVIELPIGRDTIAGPPLFTIDHTSNGKQAVTQYKVVENGEYCTKISLSPQTGRTHQLRLHMAAIGHPILGDFFYSPSSIYLATPRLMLHAERLEIMHPNKMRILSITAPTSSFEVSDCDYQIRKQKRS